ncbi:MAG TPA: transposase family protein [Thermoflexia bacterium]|nr:transposase family protein [Thermoflexia bacterium]
MDKILIDATERAHQRPPDYTKQKKMYSGKKKRHTVKNTISVTVDKVILFVGQTFTGHNYDYSMLKQEFPPEYPWFAKLHVWLDLGYQGVQTDYQGTQLEIPHKKPRNRILVIFWTWSTYCKSIGT